MVEQPIEFQGELTIKELVRFQYFHFLSRWWMFLLMAFFAAIILLIPLLLLLQYSAGKPPEEIRTFLSNVAPLIFLFCFWAIIPYWAARRHVANQRYLIELSQYTFNFEGMTVVGPNYTWRASWSVVRRVRETKTLFLLYHAPNVAALVPKRFFGTDGDLREWKDFIEARIAPKRIEKPGLVGSLC